MVTILIILGISLAVVIFGIAIYNKLIRLRNTVKSSWSDIDVQLKKRYDLVPNLVETVKGYASHEKNVFENVTKARSMAMNAAMFSAPRGSGVSGGGGGFGGGGFSGGGFGGGGGGSW